MNLETFGLKLYKLHHHEWWTFESE